MYTIQIFNSIPPAALSGFQPELYRIATEVQNPDALIVRSFNLHTFSISDSVIAVARSGIGVNTIPIEECTRRGIVVFNTPGANANSVKELILGSLLLSSRHLHEALQWIKSLDFQADNLLAYIEKEKSQFAGQEIKNKTLGVIGLGAIGVMVANAAVQLGMDVIGYDPYFSAKSQILLSKDVDKTDNIEKVFTHADYITLHIPLNDSTRNIISREQFLHMKSGITLLNFSRGELVDTAALFDALDDKRVFRYISDFPNEQLLGRAKHDSSILLFPHIGASTEEAEFNCAQSAVERLKEYLEDGSISNSVNFPQCTLERAEKKCRISIVTHNIPNMVGQITRVLGDTLINISHMINKHRDTIAYNIIDTDCAVVPDILKKIKTINGVIRVRTLPYNYAHK